jgi:predicted nucleic-acid-binding Zn-ribbon protein
MEGSTLLCRQCRNVFRIPSQNRCSIIRRTPCPKCGSSEIEEAPTWAPLGSGSNIFDSSEWEYECQECHKKFQMPIPKSPTEEKERSCPSCGAKHIHSLTTAGGAPLYCG